MWGNTYNSKFKLIVLKFIDFQKEGFSIKNDQLQILFKETEKKKSSKGGFLKTTDQPTTYHRPPTNRPPTRDSRRINHPPSASTTDQLSTYQ